VTFDQLLHKSSGQMLVFRANLHHDSEFHAGFRIEASIHQFHKENPGYAGPIPADLVTTSASGLDPDISPASAAAQAQRVAKARGIPLEEVQQLVAQNTQGRTLGFFG
jgi:K+-transporting ATPase ATPase C chain